MEDPSAERQIAGLYLTVGDTVEEGFGDEMKTILTATLEIAYEESGPADGPPVILMHGFPDDVHAYDGVAPPLASSGWRVISFHICAVTSRPDSVIRRLHVLR